MQNILHIVLYAHSRDDLAGTQRETLLQYRKEISMAKKPNVWVVPHENGWAVKREGGQKPSRVTSRKEDAVNIGRNIAKRDGAELIVQRRDGTIQSKDSYGSDPLPPRDTEH